MDDGTELIQDDETLRVVQRQARRVHWSSLLAAAVLTAVYLLVS